jgi:hypothetical protein
MQTNKPTHLQLVGPPEAPRVAAASGQAHQQVHCLGIICWGLWRQAGCLAAHLPLQPAAPAKGWQAGQGRLS